MNHQNQGAIIHHFLQRRTCCLVSALLGISTNGNSAHHLHQPSIAMRDNISMLARYQLYLAKHILHFIIQRVPRHSSIADNKLTDLKQIKSCRDGVLISQLPSDHHLSLKAYHHRIDPATDSSCSSCQRITDWNTGS